MRIKKTDASAFSIEISARELIVINNCINDSMDLMEDAEFQTRVGAFKSEARDILAVFRNALDAASTK